MSNKRRSFSASFKAKVALEALSGHRTVAEIAQHYRVHPNQVSTWKRQAVDHMEDGFKDGRRRKGADDEALKDQLYQQIGRLKVELDWLKKTVGMVER
jgi:putative transposase